MYDNGIVFADEGTVGDTSYVTVLDRGGNPIEYNIPRWEANWKYNRRNSPAIASMLDAWDGGDPWGSAMEMAWAVATVSRAMGDSEPGQTLNYRPSPIAGEMSLTEMAEGDPEGMSDISFSMECLADAVLGGRVSEDDLKFAARVLNRYIDLCDRAGQSY